MKYTVKPIDCKSKRLCGVLITIDDGIDLLLFNVYMPCDLRSYSKNFDEFNEVLTEISVKINTIESMYVVIGGDFNHFTTVTRNSGS